jgi:hypothetical protein
MKIKLLTAALLLGLSVPSTASACMCDLSDDSQLQEKVYKSFDIVATVEVLDFLAPEEPNAPQRYKLNVLAPIKGKPKQQFIAYDFEDASCGNFLQLGQVHTLGFDRQAGGRMVAHSECDQLVLDSYLAGEADLDMDPDIPLTEDGMTLGEPLFETDDRDMPSLNSGRKIERNFQN